jgi:hypothetical protein
VCKNDCNSTSSAGVSKLECDCSDGHEVLVKRSKAKIKPKKPVIVAQRKKFTAGK